MAEPLSFLSGADQNVRSPQNGSRHHKHTFEHTQDLTERTESFYDVQENLPPSSPFDPYIEAGSEISPRKSSPFKQNMSPNRQQTSPRKTPIEKSVQPSLTEDALYLNNQGLLQAETEQTPSARRRKDLEHGPEQSPAKSLFDPDETCVSTFSAVQTVGITGFARLEPSPAIVSSPKSSRGSAEFRSPRPGQPNTPGTVRTRRTDPDTSPTPRRKVQSENHDNTTQLLEFTEQLNCPAANRSPNLNAYPIHRLRSPTRDGFRPATPEQARHFANLLDFDLPPAPTPRSIPTITAHELESVKASFLSQISSLKAALSGKDAEINSLIAAKDDAERRVGETSEALRDTRDAKDGLVAEKSDWEKRDKEMQVILRDVKNELIIGEKERQALHIRATDSERQRDEAQARATELSAKLEGLEALANNASSHAADIANTPNTTHKSPNTDRAVEVAVEKVARELHQLYKEKHENKVSALKKSYEGRWERRVKELQTRVDALNQENEELRLGRDATMSGVVPLHVMAKTNASTDKTLSRDAGTATSPSKQLQQEAAAVDLATLTVRAEALDRDAREAKATAARLAAELELSRAENGELVAAVEQMLQMQSEQSVLDTTITGGSASDATGTLHDAKGIGSGGRGQSHERSLSRGSLSRPGSRLGRAGSLSGPNNDTGHVPRPAATSSTGSATALPKSSGLRGPGLGALGGYGESRIGGLGMKRSISGNTGGGHGGSSRSGIMSSIEKMGRGRGE